MSTIQGSWLLEPVPAIPTLPGHLPLQERGGWCVSAGPRGTLSHGLGAHSLRAYEVKVLVENEVCAGSSDTELFPSSLGVKCLSTFH